MPDKDQRDFLDGYYSPMLKRRAARMIFAGASARSVCKVLNISDTILRQWREKDLVFIGYTKKLETMLNAVLEDALLQGELEAIETVRAALEAQDAKKNPIWNIRLQAAFRLLDAAGRRGKPVESVEQKTLAVTGDMNKLLEQALRDPGMKPWLEQHLPGLAQDVKALPSPDPELLRGERAGFPIEEVDYETLGASRDVDNDSTEKDIPSGDGRRDADGSGAV